MRFSNGEVAPNAEQLARALALPISVIQRALTALKDSNLIVELNVLENEDIIYQPSRDINSLTISAVINALETSGRNSVPDMQGYEQFSHLDTTAEKMLLKEI